MPLSSLHQGGKYPGGSRSVGWGSRGRSPGPMRSPTILEVNEESDTGGVGGGGQRFNFKSSLHGSLGRTTSSTEAGDAWPGPGWGISFGTWVSETKVLY